MKIIRKRKKKGFTLIELIAVVAILIILAVLLVPNIVGYVNRSKIATVKSDAKVVLNIIKTARAQSSGSLDNNATYVQAISTNSGGDSDLAPSKAPANSLQSLNESQLQSIIDNNTNDWSYFSTYYQK
ncbi:type IV pilin protein [Clostridium neuense]|uniref:Type IV pilin protein n=1 Tax=Clostridium neuense TaxID=1728934 RepID=A0ABW8TI76_9CLOT